METRLKIINRHRKGDGIRQLSREMHLSRNTVRSVLRCDGTPNSSYTRANQPYRVLGDYLEILEQALRDDRSRRRKRTARQLFQELQSQGYRGSESTVSRYVCKWKKQESNHNFLILIRNM